ncbi:hypothetical protein FKG94_06120 [Exilibacterium tricleocarpae]|uniref:O-antigen ligase family protein n=1 Tax=Exilibacterium tricleocarpae TaxID=2591008 RepID=A0A545U409_9GAMM|nr:hypothetical protein [Exilibacterium tricleocarpae]TQV84231.1 hypothetical protein FKG94_06120 [Exilibacterium tricleocarpae]
MTYLVKRASLVNIFIGFAVAMFILSPYFAIKGGVLHGGLIGLFALFLSAPGATIRSLRNEKLYIIGLLGVGIGFYAILMGLLNGAPDFDHLKIGLQIPIYITFGHIIGRIWWREGCTNDQAHIRLAKFVLATAVINSILIILSHYNSELKAFLEGMLAETGNIKHAEHPFRHRGLASAGGANLSLLNALMVWIALVLSARGELKPITSILLCTILLFATLYIGRTGLLLGIGFISIFLLLLFCMLKRRRQILSWVLVFTIGGIALFPLLEQFVSNTVMKYSLFFLEDGLSSFREEGTTEILKKMLFLPESLCHLITGVGGVHNDPANRHSDIGYVKTIFAVGIPLAFFIYIAIAIAFSRLVLSKNLVFYFLPIVGALFIAELKEPFLYHGYSSRFIWSLFGLRLFYLGTRVGVEPRERSIV